MGGVCSRLASRARSKVSVLVVVAMTLVIVPLTASPAGAVTGGALRVQNQMSNPVNIWVESGGSWTPHPAVAVNGSFDVNLPTGTHGLRPCGVGSINESCAGSSLVANPTTISIADGGSYVTTLRTNLVFFTSQNDSSPTAHGQARFTIRNAFTAVAVVSVCIDGTPVLTNVPASAVSPADVAPGQDRLVRIIISASPFTSCVGGNVVPLDLAAGRELRLDDQPLCRVHALVRADPLCR